MAGDNRKARLTLLPGRDLSTLLPALADTLNKKT